MPTYWINGKRFHSDRDLSPDELESLSGPQLRPTPERGLFERAKSALFDPLTTLPSQIGRQISGMIPEMDTAIESAQQMFPGLGGVGGGNLLSFGKGFTQGAIEGAGDVASSFTAPANIIPTALGLGEVAAIRQAMGGARSAQQAASAARTAGTLGKARQLTSLPTAIHGAGVALHGESTPMERVMGTVEAAGGLAGFKAPRYTGGATYNVPPPDIGFGDFGNAPPVPRGGGLPPAPQPLLPPRQPLALPDAIMNADIIPPDMGGPMPDLPIRPPNIPRPVMDAQVLPPAFPSEPRITSMMPEQAVPPIMDVPHSGDIGPYIGPNELPVAPPRFRNMVPEIPIQDRTLTQDLQTQEINNAMSELAQRRAQQATPETGLEAPTVPKQRGQAQLEQDFSDVTDPFGRPLDRDPYTLAKQNLDERNRMGEVVDYEDELNNLNQQYGVIDTMSNDMSRYVDEVKKAHAEGYNVYPPGYKGPVIGKVVRTFEDPEGTYRVIDPRGKLDDKVSGMSMDEEGVIKLDVGDPEDVIPIMAQTYAGHTVSVAGKELIQNALDAVKHLGGKGKLSVSMDPKTRSLTVTDSGAGLTKEELATIYTDLSRSGKRGKGDFIGEMGFGKMAYLATGENVRITTISVDPKTKQLKQYVLEGSPQQLIKGAKPVESIAPVGSSTGTKVEYFPQKDEQFRSLEEYLENLNKYSNIHTPIDVEAKDLYQLPTDKPKRFQIPAGSLNPKEVIGMGEGEGTKFALSIPQNARELPKGANQIALILVNRGMFQGVDTYHVPFGVEGLPDRIVVNLDPKVDAKSNKYPLTVPTRERMTWRAKYDIEKFINEKIVGKKVKDRDAEIQRIYDNMPSSATGNFVTYDTGGKFTPEETQMILNSQALSATADELQKVTNLLTSIFASRMLGTVEKIGYVFDPKLRGVNIQNPSDNKKMVLMVNPASFFTHNDPVNAANGIIHTALHEFAHTMERPEDKVTGPIGDIYESFGIDRQKPFLDKVLNAISEVKNGRRVYRSEVQKILSRYNESRGRAETSTDLLIRKGIGLANAPEAEGRLSFSRADAGEGTTPREEMTAKEIFKEHPVHESWNVPRGLMSVDMPFVTSAALRQGLPWVASAHWWKAWEQQAKAFGSERAYRNQIDLIERDNLFRPQARFRGEGNQPIFEESIAEQMGLVITDLTNLSRREEVLKSQLAEKIPVYGKWVRGSNRAYTSFLNHIRTSAFKDLVTNMGAWDGRRITNEPLAKEIAEFVNITTGRGSGNLTFGVSREKSHTVPLDQVMGPLGEVFFSPRLWKSRLDMLNPSTFIMASPQMRMQWIKAYLSIAVAWWGIASLMQFAGAKVSTDPNNSDYGKVRMGNTRIDPGGGFQQNLVIANRVLNPIRRGDLPIPKTGITPIDLATGPLRYGGGGISSPINEKFLSYGGQSSETRTTDMWRYTTNKFHPSAKYIYDFFNRGKRQPFYLGDRTMQLFVPMFAGDLAETVMKDPALAAISLGASSVGMGAQTFEGGPGKPVFTPLTGLENFDPTFR